jgi:hypothetical protein
MINVEDAVEQINNCTGLLPDMDLDFIYNDTQVFVTDDQR